MNRGEEGRTSSTCVTVHVEIDAELAKRQMETRGGPDVYLGGVKLENPPVIRSGDHCYINPRTLYINTPGSTNHPLYVFSDFTNMSQEEIDEAVYVGVAQRNMRCRTFEGSGSSFTTENYADQKSKDSDAYVIQGYIVKSGTVKLTNTSGVNIKSQTNLTLEKPNVLKWRAELDKNKNKRAVAVLKPCDFSSKGSGTTDLFSTISDRDKRALSANATKIMAQIALPSLIDLVVEKVKDDLSLTVNPPTPITTGMEYATYTKRILDNIIGADDLRKQFVDDGSITTDTSRAIDEAFARWDTTKTPDINQFINALNHLAFAYKTQNVIGKSDNDSNKGSVIFVELRLSPGVS